jgi:predicted DNA-binding transcriptional regulator YafY
MGNDSQSDALRWTTQLRRAFIEHRLFWRGRIGLADLMDTFGMSRTQSSQDLNAYISEFPDHLSYDKSARTYVAGPKFAAHYGPLDGDAHLSKLLAMAQGADVAQADWELFQPDMLAPPIPARGAKAQITRAVLHAIEQGRALMITYQSMSSPDPSERSIAPHALAHDGFRWHCRAFCLRDQVFKDFVLGRMLSAELGEPAQVDRKADADWTIDITLTIAPNPALSDNQQKIIALDYGMEGGSAKLTVRRCMLYYALRRLGLDADPSARRAQEQHIVFLNPQEVFGALGQEVPW